MNMKKYLFTIISFLCFADSAFAGFPYIGGQLGYYHTNDNYHSTQYKGMTGRISGGYLWNISPKIKIGLEVGGAIFEKNSDVVVITKYDAYNYYKSYLYVFDVEIYRTSLDILSVVDFSLTDHLDLFLKLGGAYQHKKIKKQSVERNSSYTLNGKTPALGLGLGYKLKNHLNLTLEFLTQRAKSGDFINAKNGVYMVPMLGLRYDFS